MCFNTSIFFVFCYGIINERQVDLENRGLYHTCRSMETLHWISFFKMLVLGAALSPNLNKCNIFRVFAFSGHFMLNDTRLST